MLTCGFLQDFGYSFDAATSNLSSRSRTQGGTTTSETFYYDNLGRLTFDNGVSLVYDANNNIVYNGGGGVMTYTEASHPYQITERLQQSTDPFGTSTQTITYKAYGRPATITQGNKTATFTYDASHDRVKMYLSGVSSDGITRYYVGGRYEMLYEDGVATEFLYLGGDAYSAPMVLRRLANTSWVPYVIGRDYLGSITHIATVDGSEVTHCYYGVWGSRTNTELDDFGLARGWCGHEHLKDFGLINMNARLYDPVLGRFLSPDPYVQAPDLPANFNRYAYCLNNPLKYTDPNGEIWYIPVIIGAAIGAYAGASLQSGTLNFTQWSNDAWKGAISGAIIGGAFGFIIGSATGATGLLAADGSVTKVAGVVSSSLFDGSWNICFNAISGGTWDSAWKSGVSGLLVGAWSASGGLGMVSGFGAESKLGQLAGKLGYQTISTSLSSIGNNWANNRPMFSQMDIGIGPITFSFGSGPLFQWRKNLPAIVMNGLGVGNLLFGGHANFDWSNLSMQYSGGLVDTFFPPADGASGFGAYAIIGNSNLTKTYPTLGYRSIYEHEIHHLWHSRSLGDKYIPDYLLHSLTAICLGGAPISDKNYFESIAYGYWWF